MTHKFAVGTIVHYDGGTSMPGMLGDYKVVRQRPIERDNRIVYCIKNTAETFERTAEESQLTRRK